MVSHEILSPLGRYSCIAQGASPGLIIDIHLLSPKGAALFCLRQMLVLLVPLLVGARYYFSFVYTQGFISGFALISPWAMQECRA